MGELQDDVAWSTYFQSVYGELPSTFPLDVKDFWMLYDNALTTALTAAAVTMGNVTSNAIPPVVGKCPGRNPPHGLHYQLNNAYSPANTSWIWQPYPWFPFEKNTWVEVMHEKDPFGDEHFGAWFVQAKGSGIYLNTGNTIFFDTHDNAYDYFGVKKGDKNEEMSKKAAAAGYDTVQFMKHQDDVNYPCDPKDHLLYMNFEIVGVKMVGTYACGSQSGTGVLRTGWEASKPCTCVNTQSFTNCKGVPTQSSNSTLHPSSDNDLSGVLLV